MYYIGIVYIKSYFMYVALYIHIYYDYTHTHTHTVDPLLIYQDSKTSSQ